MIFRQDKGLFAASDIAKSFTRNVPIGRRGPKETVSRWPTEAGEGAFPGLETEAPDASESEDAGPSTVSAEAGTARACARSRKGTARETATPLETGRPAAD